jgi:hypothetical protein
MTTHTATDIINMIHNLLPEKDMTRIFEQVNVLDRLREYANQQFNRVGSIYKCKHPMITDKWEFEKYV